MKNAKPHIVFIDDGVNTKHLNLTLLYDLEVSDSLKIQQRVQQELPFMSHGTVCAGITHLYCPGIECSSVKVLNDTNWKCDIERLIVALTWCLHAQVDIVNLSLGSTYFKDARRLLPVINELAKRTLIIAAHSNKNIATYPATFSNVVGVKATSSPDGITFFNNSFEGFSLAAPAQHCLKDRAGHNFISENANSCAAPYVSALACNDYLLGNDVTINNFLSRIKAENSSAQSPLMFLTPDWVQHAVFVTEQQDKSNFLKDVLIDVQSASILTGASFCEDDAIDTVIFSEEMDYSSNVESLISKAVSTQKNIVMLNENWPLSSVLQNSGIKVWHPKKEVMYGTDDASDISVPFVVVVDTDEKRLLNVCSSLAAQFEAEGYYAPVTTNIPYSALSGRFYKSSCDVDDLRYWKQLQHCYAADVLVCGVRVSDTVPEACRTVLAQVADIAIMFLTPHHDQSFNDVSIHVTPSKLTFAMNNTIDTISYSGRVESVLSAQVYNLLSK